MEPYLVLMLLQMWREVPAGIKIQHLREQQNRRRSKWGGKVPVKKVEPGTSVELIHFSPPALRCSFPWSQANIDLVAFIYLSTTTCIVSGLHPSDRS